VRFEQFNLKMVTVTASTGHALSPERAGYNACGLLFPLSAVLT
jgi:hypothetical protein